MRSVDPTRHADDIPSPEVLHRRRVVERHARPGESWADAERRLFGGVGVVSDEDRHACRPEVTPWARVRPETLLYLLFQTDTLVTERRKFHASRSLPIDTQVSILMRGKELRREDREVWLFLVERSARLEPGALVEFSAPEFCAVERWPANRSSYTRLRDSLLRLQTCTLAVRCGNIGAALPLLSAFWWADAGDGDTPLRRYTAAVPLDLVEVMGRPEASPA